jgi:hypothetical protein
VGTEKRREKVVVLRELQRAIIYTRELSKQAREGHVSTAFTVYSVNEGARLTSNIQDVKPVEYLRHRGVCVTHRCTSVNLPSSLRPTTLCTRLLASSVAAVTDRAPLSCVVAPRPELEKA